MLTKILSKIIRRGDNCLPVCPIIILTNVSRRSLPALSSSAVETNDKLLSCRYGSHHRQYRDADPVRKCVVANVRIDWRRWGGRSDWKRTYRKPLRIGINHGVATLQFSLSTLSVREALL